MAVEAKVDGRTARAERTRTAVVDALLDLIDAGTLQPTAQEVATRAGVSPRIVYFHFDDHARLFAAAAARQSERVLADIKLLRDDGPLDERIDALVNMRARIFERVYNTRRAARLHEHCAPIVAQSLAFVRALKREEAERVFGRELSAMRPPLRRDRAHALGCVTSFNTWESLRAHAGLSLDEARRVWRGLVAAVLHQED